MAVKRASEKAQHRKPDDVLRQELNEYVAARTDLDGVDVRVFLYLSGLLNFERFVPVPQIQIATVLGRQKTHISRAIRSLVGAGILVAGPNGTRSSEWRLNPDFGR
jgi:predicted transcriptional regulator